MKYMIFLATLSGLALMVGCGEGGKEASNQKTVANLSALMAANPALSKANLKQIKDASDGNASTNAKSQTAYQTVSVPRLKVSGQKMPRTHEEAVVLEKGVATRAQGLIEDALWNFDFIAHFDAVIKLVGIGFNMQNKYLDQAERQAKEGFGGKGFGDEFDKDFSFKGDNSGGWDNSKSETRITCDNIVNNPFLDFSRDMLDQAISQDKDLMLETISGCPEIKGGEFLQCLDDFNKFVTLVNEHASCSVQDLRELKKIIKEKANVDLDRLDNSVGKCMYKQFKQCGFENHDIGTAKRPHKSTLEGGSSEEEYMDGPGSSWDGAGTNGQTVGISGRSHTRTEEISGSYTSSTRTSSSRFY